MRPVLALFLAVVFLEGCSPSPSQAPLSLDQGPAYPSAGPTPSAVVRNHSRLADVKVMNTWNPKSASAYLDQREVWWMQWAGSQRDHQTFCISCHTVVPYALSRPTLRKALGERDSSANDRRLFENVSKRVRLWKEVAPFYSDQEYGKDKAVQSRGTESVLNALVLASHDAQEGHLSHDARLAFDNMWALQLTSGDKKGAWAWLQFDLAPWEASDSQYYGAALAAVAVGLAPEDYRSTPGIQDNLKLLSEYLRGQYSSQAALNRVYLLWASSKLPGLLSPDQRKSIVDEILSTQKGDGGWNLASLSGTWRSWSISSLVRKWKREDGTPQEAGSDGYATGLVVYVLQIAGVSPEDEHLKRARAWLVRSQDENEGYWFSSSLNKKRVLSSNVGRFMSDAATAYAVLALTQEQPASEPLPLQVADH
jgi:squalene-hopene/tetraprenyl-beta-curcumene cyclase